MRIETVYRAYREFADLWCGAVQSAMFNDAVGHTEIADQEREMVARYRRAMDRCERRLNRHFGLPASETNRARAFLDGHIKRVRNHGTVLGLALGAALLGLIAMPADAAQGQSAMDVEVVIADAAERWGASEAQLRGIAWCESRFDPGAVNRRDGSLGLFQFQPRTFGWASVQAGYAGASPFDPEAAANTAAMLVARGETYHWGGCAR